MLIMMDRRVDCILRVVELPLMTSWCVIHLHQAGIYVLHLQHSQANSLAPTPLQNFVNMC